MGNMITNALRKWQINSPSARYDSCCGGNHVDVNNQWLSDAEVCDRERAWRCYVRLRDGNPRFPYEVKSLDHDFVSHAVHKLPNVSEKLMRAIEERRKS